MLLKLFASHRFNSSNRIKSIKLAIPIIISLATSMASCKARGSRPNGSKSKGIIGSDSGDVSTFLFKSPANPLQICALQCDFAGVAEIIDQRDPSHSGESISLREAGCFPKAKCVDKSGNASIFDTAVQQCSKTLNDIESDHIESVPQDCEQTVKKIADLVTTIGTDLNVYESPNKERIETQLSQDLSKLRQALSNFRDLPSRKSANQTDKNQIAIEKVERQRESEEEKLKNQNEKIRQLNSLLSTLSNITAIADRENKSSSGSLLKTKEDEFKRQMKNGRMTDKERISWLHELNRLGYESLAPREQQTMSQNLSSAIANLQGCLTPVERFKMHIWIRGSGNRISIAEGCSNADNFTAFECYPWTHNNTNPTFPFTCFASEIQGQSRDIIFINSTTLYWDHYSYKK